MNQSKTVVETVLAHITDEWWEQVILLTGGHPKLSEDFRVELVAEALKRVESLEPGSDERQRHLLMAGLLARDMAEYLPGPEHERVEQALYAAAVNGDNPPGQRAAAADTLDELGYAPADLFAFIPSPDSQAPKYLIAKYPVTNAQYARFLTKENFENEALWMGFPKFDENCAPMRGSWDKEALEWLRKQEKENGIIYPTLWRDARFGISRPNAPVVRVTWYEANAYCKWLLANWTDLEEGQQGLPKPQEIRLPLENEWVLAAGGEENQRFAFGELKDKKEITRYANTRESGIGRTTPVWLFPQQGAKQPFGVMDMSGNVWEWQANYRSEKNNWLGLRGGSWHYDVDGARVSAGDDDYPHYRLNSVGFRVWVVALPS